MTEKLTALAFMIGLVAAMPVMAEEEPASEGCAAYWPLVPGAVWSYDFTGDAGTVELRREVVGEADGCVELRCRQGAHESWEYVTTRADAIARLANAYLGGDRGVGATRLETPLLRGPVVAGSSWTWITHGSVQTMVGGPPGPSMEALRIDAHATIEATDDQVQVPAGRFEALRVRVVTTSPYFGDGETLTWWAAGVGPVKVVQRAGGVESVTELRSYTLP
jgi:hypothetical protein